MHTLSGLVVLLGGPGDVTWQHFPGNLGLLLEKAQETSPKNQISTMLSNSVEMRPNREGEGWGSQHGHINLVQQAALTARHLNCERDQDRQELGAGAGMDWCCWAAHWTPAPGEVKACCSHVMRNWRRVHVS